MEAGRRANIELHSLVNTQGTQIDNLSKKQHETEQQMAKEREMMNRSRDMMSKKHVELGAKL